MKANILVVDDEQDIANLVALYLTNEDFQVFQFHCAADALTCINEQKIDLALLDVMLPDGDGFSICQKIREKHSFPVIMLTAKEEETDKITGLTLGADDYITKPFRPLELVARVKAQLRRYTKYNSAAEAATGVLIHGGLVVDVNTHECTLDGRRLNLTPIEFLILQILCEQQGNVVNSEQLFHAVWGEDYFNKNANSIPTHIRHLREKMDDCKEQPQYIKTVWGVGYKIGK